MLKEEKNVTLQSDDGQPSASGSHYKASCTFIPDIPGSGKTWGGIPFNNTANKKFDLETKKLQEISRETLAKSQRKETIEVRKNKRE